MIERRTAEYMMAEIRTELGLSSVPFKQLFRKWILVEPVRWNHDFNKTESGLYLANNRYFNTGVVLKIGDEVCTEIEWGMYVYCSEAFRGIEVDDFILVREKDVLFTSWKELKVMHKDTIQV